MINSWFHIHNIHPNNISEILNQYLAYNQYIQIDNKHLDSKHDCLNMLSDFKLGDIITSRNTIMNHEELSQKYNFKIDPWKCMTIMAAIPREWKLKIKSDSNLQDKLSTFNYNET